MPNTQGWIRWRWLKCQCLLEIMFLSRKIFDVIQEIGVDICDRDIQACHRLKDRDQTIVKFTNRKDCL